MIISPDKTKVFFAITKTGSTTVEALLSQIPGVIVLNDDRIKHGRRSDLDHEIDINPELSGMNAWDITAYGFLRDPIDRFFSSCNYLKQFPLALTNLFPEIFPEGSLPIPVMTTEFKRRISISEWNSTLTQEQRTTIRNLTPYDFLNIPIQKLGTSMDPQWKWIQQDVTVLRHNDFENETRKLISLFGGDPTVSIPKLNAADDFPASVKYARDPEIQQLLHERYFMDFQLAASYGVWE